jgi:hypothetical protein
LYAAILRIGAELDKGRDKDRVPEGIASRLSSPTYNTRATSTSMSTFAMAAKNPGKHTVHGLLADPVVQGNLSRTYLKPLAEKPHRQKHTVRRQNVYEGERRAVAFGV